MNLLEAIDVITKIDQIGINGVVTRAYYCPNNDLVGSMLEVKKWAKQYRTANTDKVISKTIGSFTNIFNGYSMNFDHFFLDYLSTWCV